LVVPAHVRSQTVDTRDLGKSLHGEPAESRNRTDPAAPHDVLAAEEFALPAPDPSISHAPVVLPDDPSGISEPHDVLAAEEFALPASAPHLVGGSIAGSAQRDSRQGGVILGLLGLLVLGRIVRRLGR